MSNITSGPGLGGQTWYYKDGEYIGWSGQGLLGETVYYNKYDQYVGESVEGLLGETLFSDNTGRYMGSAVDVFGSKTYEDENGHYAGMSVTLHGGSGVIEDGEQPGMFSRMFGDIIQTSKESSSKSPPCDIGPVEPYTMDDLESFDDLCFMEKNELQIHLARLKELLNKIKDEEPDWESDDYAEWEELESKVTECIEDAAFWLSEAEKED